MLCKRCLTVLTLAIFQLGTINSQTSTDTTTLQQAQEHYQKALQFFRSNFDSCEIELLAALPLFEAAGDQEKVINCYNGLYAVNYYAQNIKAAEKYGNLALETAKAQFGEQHDTYITALNNMGTFYDETYDLDRALKNYQQAYQQLKDQPGKKQEQGLFLHNIANAFEKKGDYQSAIQYLQASLQLYLDTLGPLHQLTAKNYFSQGLCFRKMGDFARAKKSLKKSLSAFNQLDKTADYNKTSRIDIYHTLAKTYLENQQADSALVVLEEALDLQKNTDYRAYLSSEIAGLIYSDLNQPEKASHFFHQAIDQAPGSAGKISVNSILARNLEGLGQLSLYHENPEEAIANFNQGLQLLSIAPDEEQAAKDYFNPIEALELLEGKIEAQLLLFQQGQDQGILLAAMNTAQQAQTLITHTRKTYLSADSRRKLSEEALAIYESGIITAQELWKSTGERQYLDAAFTYMEQNKALSLLESLNEQVANQYGGLPPELSAQERKLKADIYFYEQLIQEEELKATAEHSPQLAEWTREAIQLKQSYQQLLSQLEEQYPRYHQLKYQDKIPGITQMQQTLAPEATFLEYFIGPNEVFLMVLTANEAQLISLGTTQELSIRAQAVLDEITHPPGEFSEEAFLQMTAVATTLYEKLVQPAFAPLDQMPGQLIIVPDGFLNYLPFEVLINGTVDQEEISFKTLPYLFHQSAISYSYSAALLLKSMDFQPSSGLQPFLGVAPSFQGPIAESRNCTGNTLYDLRCSQEEVKKIAQLWQGTGLLGAAASKVAFLQQADEYQILHLATHSCVHADQPMLNRIFFTDDYLTNYDLFSQSFNAELAVLSSCNSGSGQYIKGDGVMSLSKGFIYAGCPSTLISLWSVDDCATSEIMLYFYRQLHQSTAKNEAIRQAKLEYLNHAPKALQHPYYWAAFVQTGNFLPLGKTQVWYSSRWFYLLAAAGILLLGYLFIQKQKVSNAK